LILSLAYTIRRYYIQLPIVGVEAI
jgi:hypothetical protein